MRTNRLSLWKVMAVFGVMTILTSCATLNKIPLFSATVKVTDEADAPIAGAIVDSSDGQQATTGADGMATLKFGSLGVHMITVTAENRTSASFSVTMPLDSGKTMSARLGKVAAMGGGGHPGGSMVGMHMTALYPVIFQSMFTAYGYNMEMAPYKTGEWTEWDFQSGNEKQMVMRKAFLAKFDNKQEWWQVQLLGEGKADNLILEVLFSPERHSIRRMRQKTGNGKPSEVPVSEGWYSAPMELTPESIEGSVVKKGVAVTVPAGKFTADLLEFAYMGSGTTVRMWRVRSVPGGIVRVELAHEENEPIWVSELKAYGKEAKTLLGSF